MGRLDEGWGAVAEAEARRDVARNAMVSLVRLAWELTPRYPQAWSYTPAQLAYLGMLEAEKGRQDLVQAALAVRAGGASEEWWKGWIARQM
ncbi:hypothetical protein [Methylobacterium sp. MA0201]|uniref:hypothetical protein n=1 Tax=Methylobacterium alsaeris TaxID=3344826 RepID=UPI0037563783